MAFQKYVRAATAQRKALTPKISISKGGLTTFNSLVVDEYLRMNEEGEYYPFLEVYYDDETNKIGFRPTEEEATSHPTISYGGSRRVHARVYLSGFLGKFGIDIEQATHYTPEWDENDGMIVIDLTKGEASDWTPRITRQKTQQTGVKTVKGAPRVARGVTPTKHMQAVHSAAHAGQTSAERYRALRSQHGDDIPDEELATI
jgi:hypothetical protein